MATKRERAPKQKAAPVVDGAWVSARQMAEILGISPRRAFRLARTCPDVRGERSPIVPEAWVRAQVTPTSTGVLLDLYDGLAIARDAVVPAMAELPDGRGVVAWASIRLEASEKPRPWVARLSSVGGRVERTFIDRASSRNDGYDVENDGHFAITAKFFRQEHPLSAGVHEATSRCAGGPPGYAGRAAFDVHPDGTIEILHVGARDKAPPRDVVAELVRRIAVHDARDGRAPALDDRKAVAEVRSDEQIQRYGFPDLQGSPKQVTWAMDIRRRAFDELLGTGADGDRLAAVVRSILEARWWIDHRDRIAAELSRRMHEGHSVLVGRS